MRTATVKHVPTGTLYSASGHSYAGALDRAFRLGLAYGRELTSFSRIDNSTDCMSWESDSDLGTIDPKSIWKATK